MFFLHPQSLIMVYTLEKWHYYWNKQTWQSCWAPLSHEPHLHQYSVVSDRTLLTDFSVPTIPDFLTWTMAAAS